MMKINLIGSVGFDDNHLSNLFRYLICIDIVSLSKRQISESKTRKKCVENAAFYYKKNINCEFKILSYKDK